MIITCRDAAASRSSVFPTRPRATSRGDRHRRAGHHRPDGRHRREGRRRGEVRQYPPLGRRSQGAGQYGSLWGDTYRQTANDNVMIVAMIENPAGVEIVDKIAAVPGIDVVFVASTDLGSFSGYAGRCQVRGPGHQSGRDDGAGRGEAGWPAGVEEEPQGLRLLSGAGGDEFDQVRDARGARLVAHGLPDDGRGSDRGASAMSSRVVTRTRR